MPSTRLNRSRGSSLRPATRQTALPRQPG